MLSRGLRVAFIQLAVGPDKTKNIAKAVESIRNAKQKGAELIALPECFNSPYGTKFFNEYAEEIPKGATCQALSKIAGELGVVVVGGTVPERCDGKLYNTCTVWDTNGIMIAKHRKVHLFDIDIPGKMTFKESEVLTGGDTLNTFNIGGAKIGLGICYDLRFEEMARAYANMGCNVLLYPGAFNMTTGPLHWELLARSRANDLQLYMGIISPARDTGAGYVAWGHSTLVNPWGVVTAKAGHEEEILLADIDLTVVEEVRSQIPTRQQRRTDVYDTILMTKKNSNL
ncbi:omega-amidase NIT2 isoform X2 [Arctopsyche grandis]|uniref:omega-amidase NIT2 isoform X2 n=1 Tax=Arctopsyche grandis TaxID=121162 RepID=UPI00406D8154